LEWSVVGCVDIVGCMGPILPRNPGEVKGGHESSRGMPELHEDCDGFGCDGAVFANLAIDNSRSFLGLDDAVQDGSRRGRLFF